MESNQFCQLTFYQNQETLLSSARQWKCVVDLANTGHIN